jgi:hypothetical protein
MENRRDLIVTAGRLQTLIPSVSGRLSQICPLADAAPTLFGDIRIAGSRTGSTDRSTQDRLVLVAG